MKAKIRSLAVFVVLTIAARAQTAVDWDFRGGSGVPLSLSANVSMPENLFGQNEQSGNHPRFNGVKASFDYSGVNGPASGGHNASIGAVAGPLDPATSTYFVFTVGTMAAL